MSPLIRVPFGILLLWKSSFRCVWWDVLNHIGTRHLLLGHQLLDALTCASHALEVLSNILPQMAWNEPHGTLGPKYVLNSLAWWYYPDILALVSSFIALLSCFTACSISIIAIIREWLTKWQRCRCNVSPRESNRAFLWATKRLEQSFVMTGRQGETSLPNFSRTRSNPQTVKCMRITALALFAFESKERNSVAFQRWWSLAASANMFFHRTMKVHSVSYLQTHICVTGLTLLNRFDDLEWL